MGFGPYRFERSAFAAELAALHIDLTSRIRDR